MAFLRELIALAGQLTGLGPVSHLALSPAGLLALATVTLASLLALAIARTAATSAALITTPLTRRAAALRQKSWSARFQRLSDPDAAGRARPRAPSAVPAGAW